VIDLGRPRRQRLAALAVATRSLPISFAIVGVQKAGTTSLYSMLSRHRLIAAGPQKEMRFFIEPHDWDNPDYSTYRRPLKKAEPTIAGDATPAYLFFPGAIERMHRYDPDLRLIASFRDPLERALSQWAMERSRHARYPDLPEAIERWGDDQLPEAYPQDAKPSPMLQGSPFVRGLYGAQFERALAFFPRDQWLLVEFRRLLRDPHAVLDEATDHLAVPRFTAYPSMPHQMATPTENPGARPSVAAFEALVRRYADDLTLFERLSGLDLSDWPTKQAADGVLEITALRDRLCDKLGLRA
jgi:hypothetical protein